MACDNAFLWITTERASMTGSTVLARFLDDLLGKWNDVYEKKSCWHRKATKREEKTGEDKEDIQAGCPKSFTKQQQNRMERNDK